MIDHTQSHGSVHSTNCPYFEAHGTASKTFQNSIALHRSQEESEVDFKLREVVQIHVGREGALHVRELLKAMANPNRRFEFTQDAFQKALALGGKKRSRTYSGTAVAVVVMRSEIEMLRALIEGDGLVYGQMSFYTFKAGLRKAEMSCPPIFAAACLGDHKIMKELLKLYADVEEIGTLDGKDNNTVLWSACYHGHSRVVRDLLVHIANKPDIQTEKFIETCAQHQDNAELTYTPLHIACREGHVDVVEQLIEFLANINTYNKEHTALTEAIDHDRQEVVKSLVGNLADILSDNAFDWLFERKNNMVTISAAAEGLRDACRRPQEEEMLDYYISEKLDSTRLVKFLETPGDAKMHIVHVMFRETTIRQVTSQQRRVFSHTHVPNGKFNTCCGPPGEFFPVTKDKERLPQFRQFMSNLMPGEWHDLPDTGEEAAHGEEAVGRRLSTRKSMQRQGTLWKNDTPPTKVPVDIYRCVLKGIYASPEVLVPLAEADHDSIFQEPGVQAIVTLGWRSIRFRYTTNLVMNIVFAGILISVTVDLNHEEEPDWGAFNRVKRTVLIFIYLQNLSHEVMQMIGYYHLGKLTVYLLDPGNLVDWLRVGLTGFSLANIVWNDSIIRKSGYPNDPHLFRLCISVTVFFRWMKVLYSMRGYEFAGNYLLPVLDAMSVVYPFMLVVIFPVIGFVHAYYVYGVYGKDFFRSFVIIYRVGLVGDFDLEEMEDIDPWFTWTNQTDASGEAEIGIEDPLFTKWRVYATIVLIAVTLMVTISLMNIFIAVLGECYNTAYGQKEQIFWRNRTRIVLDETFKLRLERDLKFYMCQRCCRRNTTREQVGNTHSMFGVPAMPSTPKRADSKVSTTSMDPGEWDYVWFCRPHAAARQVADGEIESDDGYREHAKDLDEVKAQISSLHNYVKSHMKTLTNEVRTLKESMAGSSIVPTSVSPPTDFDHKHHRRSREDTSNHDGCRDGRTRSAPPVRDMQGRGRSAPPVRQKQELANGSHRVPPSPPSPRGSRGVLASSSKPNHSSTSDKHRYSLNDPPSLCMSSGTSSLLLLDGRRSHGSMTSAGVVAQNMSGCTPNAVADGFTREFAGPDKHKNNHAHTLPNPGSLLNNLPAVSTLFGGQRPAAQSQSSFGALGPPGHIPEGDDLNVADSLTTQSGTLH